MGIACCRKAPVETPEVEDFAQKKAKEERDKLKDSLKKENGVLEKDIKVLEKAIDDKKASGFVREPSREAAKLKSASPPTALSPPLSPKDSPRPISSPPANSSSFPEATPASPK